jgi:Cu-Zn family superoxide dismutase
MRSLTCVVAVCLASIAGYTAAADNVEVRVHAISADGVGKEVGTLTLAAAAGGVSFTPDLHGFAQGLHAFHVHEKPDCGAGTSGGKQVAGLAAGAHYAGSMGGHGMSGHNMTMPMAGDLPELMASADGSITKPVVKPGLTLAELHGRSIMIHEYGEQPADPAKPKGGGARIACALIP